jgi:hypothetical protein
LIHVLTIFRCLPISSLITPATLFVVTGTRLDQVIRPVPQLDMWTQNATTGQDQPRLYAYYVPSRNKSSNDTQIFMGPRTIISRVLGATLGTGQILTINPPELNTSYQLNFHGPAYGALPEGQRYYYCNN